MFEFNIGEEVISRVRILKRKDTGKEKMYLVQAWVFEEELVPIQGIDEAIEEAQKEIIVENIPKNGHGEENV